MLIWFIAIFIVSLILAFRSMRDFDIPSEIKHLLMSKRVRGTILFLKGKIKHYSSISSSLSSGS